MDFEKLIVAGFGIFVMYFMIFHTEKWKEINREGYRNMDEVGKRVNTVGKVALTATKTGMGLLKMFKRR